MGSEVSPNHIECVVASIEELLKRPVLEVPLFQRAKFEGWLKIELGFALQRQGALIELESSLKGFRVDVRAEFKEETYLLMLKTVNTNFRFPDVLSLGRPITKNFKDVTEDLFKLSLLPRSVPGLESEQNLPAYGYVIFPTFPVPAWEVDRSFKLERYVERLLRAGRIEREGLVIPPCSRHEAWGIAWYIVRPTDELIQAGQS